MYKVIVADDEAIIRRGLIDKVDWNKYGFEVVGEAGNGIDALELVEREEPDLIITYIRMPFLSGIELAREIRKIRPMLSIVFLSGYDDFTYAQQAIEYNIISYLLKPITAKEFEAELQKIRQQIDEKFDGFVNESDVIKRLEKAEFLYPLLLDEQQDVNEEEEELRATVNEYGFDVEDENSNKRFTVFVTKMIDDKDYNRTDKKYVEAIDSIAGKYVNAMSCYLKGRIITVISDTERNIEKYTDILTEEILQSVERILHMRCVMGVSRKVENIMNCRECYLDAMKAISYSNSNSSESDIFFIEDAEKRKQSSSLLSEKVIKLIDEEFANQQLSVQYASEKIGLSPNYLSAIIKKETGSNFVFLMTKRRIKHAEDLLQNTDMKIRVTCVGDSITDGYMASGDYMTYPSQLQRMLGSDYTVTNAGVSGTTVTGNVDNAYSKTERYSLGLQSDPDIVIIMLGINDSVLEGITTTDGRARFKEDYIALVNEYKNCGSNPEIILTLPTTCVYSDVQEYTIYNVADYLYQNLLMQNVAGHNYLYDSILKNVNGRYEMRAYE
jgi:YesN/AraC family two-component response regulator